MQVIVWRGASSNSSPVNIRNKNTWAAYGRAAADFLGWREGQGIGELGRAQPVHVAAYIELLHAKRSGPGMARTADIVLGIPAGVASFFSQRWR
jgi:hypothetical protein